MSRLSKVVLGISAVILPIFGAFPGMTMDKMADAVMNFMRSGELAHQVHYFTWVNLKGGLISIGIGVLVYLFVIRKVFMRKDRYVDLWPEKLDVEVLFTKAVLGFVSLLGAVSKVLDGVLLNWLTIENVLKFLNRNAKVPEKIPEGIIGRLRHLLFDETTEAPEQELVNKLHAQYDRKVDTMRVIGSSLSFGLLIACVGLIITIIYLLIN